METTKELTHPVVGFRDWNPRSYRLNPLMSQAADYHWVPGVNEAQHINFALWGRGTPLDHHRAPTQNCQCGLYAYHELEYLQGIHPDTQHWVRGLIRGWGKVFVHAEGWRAQFAEILALIDYGDLVGADLWPLGLGSIAKPYRIPVVPASAFPEILSEFGRGVPRHLWPSKDHSERQHQCTS